DEVDACLERCPHQRARFALAELADRLPHAAAAESHGAETDLGNEQTGAAERAIFHRWLPDAAMRSAAGGTPWAKQRHSLRLGRRQPAGARIGGARRSNDLSRIFDDATRVTRARVKGEGYLLATVYRGTERRRALAIFDAMALEKG